MSADGFFDYLNLHKAMEGMSDDFGLPVDKAAIYLGRSVSQMNKLRLRAGAGPRYYKDRGGRVFYLLGDLRQWHRDASKPLRRSTADVDGAYSRSALVTNLARQVPFWLDGDSGLILGPVYGPLSPDCYKTLMDPMTEVLNLTPVAALLRPWKQESAREQAKNRVIEVLNSAPIQPNPGQRKSKGT